MGSTIPETVKAVYACNHERLRFVVRGSSWRLLAVDELIETLKISDIEDYSFRLVHTKALLFARFRNSTSIPDLAGNALSLERIAKTITISSYDTSHLYLDPSDGFSVWKMYGSDGFVEKLDSCLWKWSSGCSIDIENTAEPRGAFTAGMLSAFASERHSEVS